LRKVGASFFLNAVWIASDVRKICEVIDILPMPHCRCQDVEPHHRALHGAMRPSFDYAAKRFLPACDAGVSVADLPRKERRNDPEELGWQTVRVRGWPATAPASVQSRMVLSVESELWLRLGPVWASG